MRKDDMNKINDMSMNNYSLETLNNKKINWEKVNGLIPAIIQDDQTHTVLMLGYMNQQALAQTLTTQIITFYSRSRKQLWKKGETSGNYFKLVEIFLDCDQDTLLIKVIPHGPACHLGYENCFNSLIKNEISFTFLKELQTILQERYQNPNNESYTSRLYQEGISRIAQKVGEEAVETAIAAVSAEPKVLLNESADLIFHLLVLLTAKSLQLEDVVDILQQRHHDIKIS